MNYTPQQWIDQVMAEYEHDQFKSARVDFLSQNKQLWSISRTKDVRHIAIKKLVKEAYLKSKKLNFEFLISTDDIPYNSYVKKYFVFATTTRHNEYVPESYENVIPDYSFDSLYLKTRHNIGDRDYSYKELIPMIIETGMVEPTTNKLGWIGGLGTYSRIQVYDKVQQNPFLSFCDFISTDHHNRNALYLDFLQQIKKWRFICDIEGLGWTDRLKHYFFSNRVVFHVNRNNKEEFYFKDLIPWKHYVPINSDLSNLEESYLKVLNNPELENEIKTNAKQFALNNLTYEHCLQQYVNKMDNTQWNQCSVDLSKLNVVENSNLPIISGYHGELTFEILTN